MRTSRKGYKIGKAFYSKENYEAIVEETNYILTNIK